MPGSFDPPLYLGDLGGMSQPAKTKLHALRTEIDRLNHEILALLAERAQCVGEIAEIKEELALGAHDPLREEEMLRRLLADLPAPLDDEDVREIFRAVFRSGVKIQHRRGDRRDASRATG